jgi:hypothetical protein
MYLPDSCLFSYLSTSTWEVFLTKLDTKVKANITSIEVHPQRSNNRNPVDSAQVGAGSLWPTSLAWNMEDVLITWNLAYKLHPY